MGRSKIKSRSHHDVAYLLVGGIASIFMVDYSSIYPTDDRPIIDFFYSTVGQYIRNTFRDKLYFIPVRITVFPAFRIYQKNPLPVNMAVVINKQKIHEKSMDLLKESLENCLKYKKYVDIKTHKEGQDLIDF